MNLLSSTKIVWQNYIENILSTTLYIKNVAKKLKVDHIYEGQNESIAYQYPLKFPV